MSSSRSSAPAAAPPPGSTDPGFVPEEETANKEATEAQAAVSALELAVARNPVNAEAHYRLGLVLRRVGRKAEALEHLERTVQLGPVTPDKLLDLGVAYADLSRFPEAEEAYQRLLAVSPGDAKALHNLGNIALRRGEFDKAIDLYRKAIVSRPDYLIAFYHLGHALKFVKRYDEAAAAYKKVIGLTPANQREQDARTDCLYQLASIDLIHGQAERAAKTLSEVVRIAPNHPFAHYVLARALLQLGREEEAKREMDAHMKLLESHPAEAPAATAR